jgi:inosine-uridine nucleoside N-ribohydrolase
MALASAGPVAADQGAPRRPAPVIIDTDIGDDIDDAFALAIAVSDPRLQVLAVTTAFGDTRARVLLTRRLLKAMGRGDIVVGEGPATADPTTFTQKAWALEETDVSPAPDAVAVIRDAVARRPGEITLIALAPMTNVAALLARSPATLRGLRQVVLMGGSVHAGYNGAGGAPNPQPAAEYNIAQVPEAFAGLLAAGAPVVMFPLDATQVRLDQTRLDELFARGSPTSGALHALFDQWRRLNAWGQSLPTLFDAAPVAWMLEPSLCAPTPLRIEVGGEGFTRPVAGPFNADVCLSIDESRTKAIIMSALAPHAAGDPR